MTIPYIKKSPPIAFWKKFSENLSLPCIILKNGQIYFKNLAVFTLQVFKVSLVIFQHHTWKGQGLLRKTFINECTLTNMRTIHPVTSLKQNSSWAISLHTKKISFPLSISSVSETKSRVSCGFGHIYWRNPSWKTSFFVQTF